MHISKFVSLLVFVVSINTIAQHSKNIENYTFDELSEKYYEYKFTDYLEAKKFANFYFNKAVKEKDTVNAIDGKYYLSEVYKNDSIYINYLDSLISKTKLNPNKMYPTYAYLSKTTYFINKEKANAGLKNCLKGLEFSKTFKNDSLKYLLKEYLSSIKSYHGKHKDAIKDLLDCVKYYDSNFQNIDKVNYVGVLINLSAKYLKIDDIDSSKIYNKKALLNSMKLNDSILIGYCLYIDAKISFKENDFRRTIINSKKSIPLLIKSENFRLLSKSYNFIAKSYEKLDNYKNALKFHFLVDSLYEQLQIPSKHLKYNFKFIANHYKNDGDLHNQLKYIEKQIFLDSIQASAEKKLSKTFTEEYDRPKLIAEKQKIISELNNEVSFYKKSRIYIAIVLILSFILFLYQFRKRKKQEQQFEKLTLKLKNKKEVENSVNSNTNTQKNLPETIITELLAKLDSFEQQPENFTNSKLTLSTLAKELETNSNYLSKVINQKKGCNFSTYLRKLRIDYALDLLEKDATIRKFSIDAIAKEVGFKNAETFSKAFFKETELNPSFYIKQLEKKK